MNTTPTGLIVGESPGDHYAWLKAEIASVATRKFFIIEGPSSATGNDDTVLKHDEVGVEFPPSYVEFLRDFGRSQFFRDSSGVHTFCVDRRPERWEVDEKSEGYWRVGRYDQHDVVLRRPEEATGGEWPVYEAGVGRSKLVADRFEAWLRPAWLKVRSRYSDRRWRKIVAGPPPFTPEELEIIDARRRFRWRLIGVDDDQTVHFEVRNGSTRRLPFIGVRVQVRGARDSAFVGLAVKVDHIAPGASSTVAHRGLRMFKSIDRVEIEVCDAPDPGPEDRELRGEFRPLPAEPETT